MSRAKLLIGLVGLIAASILAQKASVPRTPDKDALARQHTVELLMLMDTDKDGKVSKQEWLTFMETEFDKLDKAKAGKVDIKQLQQAILNRPVRGATTR
jgi:Ca2+-binding EF-hand superfamily protein